MKRPRTIADLATRALAATDAQAADPAAPFCADCMTPLLFDRVSATGTPQPGSAWACFAIVRGRVVGCGRSGVLRADGVRVVEVARG